MLFGHQASGPAGLLKVQGSATSLAAEDHPDGAGRRWRGRGHGYGQRDAGRVVAASGLQHTALGVRAQHEPLVLDPPGICGEEQIIPRR